MACTYWLLVRSSRVAARCRFVGLRDDDGDGAGAVCWIGAGSMKVSKIAGLLADHLSMDGG
jgi:hypothetical protein